MAETKTIERRIEDAVISLFPSTTVDLLSVTMHNFGDNSFEKTALYAVAACKDLALIPEHYPCKDFTALIELVSISQVIEDKSGLKCDKLMKILKDFLMNTVTKSALSTASGLTIDAVIFESSDSAVSDDYHVKTCSAKIFMQNAE